MDCGLARRSGARPPLRDAPRCPGRELDSVAKMFAMRKRRDCCSSISCGERCSEGRGLPSYTSRDIQPNVSWRYHNSNQSVILRIYIGYIS